MQRQMYGTLEIVREPLNGEVLRHVEQRRELPRRLTTGSDDPHVDRRRSKLAIGDGELHRFATRSTAQEGVPVKAVVRDVQCCAGVKGRAFIGRQAHEVPHEGKELSARNTSARVA